MYLKCVDDSNRPMCIPEEGWLVCGDLYLPLGFCKETGGVILEEFDLNRYGEQYKAFNKKRFRMANRDEIAGFKIVKALLNELNIKTK